MEVKRATFEEALLEEARRTPVEYRAALLQLVRLFRESVTLKSAADSFRQGWSEAMAGETLDVETLWDGVDAE